jgi:hypothetical protein
MSNQITVLSTLGTSPYDVYVCDITNTYCYLAISGTNLTTYVFDVPYPLNNVEQLLLKIIDSNGCEKFIFMDCNTLVINEKMFEDGTFFLFEDGTEFIFED